MRRGIVILAALVVSVLAVVAGSGDHRVVTSPPGSKTGPVHHGVLTCPPAVWADTARVLAGSPSSVGRSGAGSLTIAPTASSGARVSARLTSAQQMLGYPRHPNVPLDVVATGDRAPGVAALRWWTAASKTRRGLTVAPCGAPGRHWWFQPVDTSVGTTSRLVVTNPASTVAVVDLRLFGPNGPVDAVGRRGIAIAPGTTRQLSLATFAPGVDALTVGVVATSGLVVAGVETSVRNGLTPSGLEWLAPTSEPATDVVVNPVVRGRGQRHLVIANATSESAVVQVEVLGSDGPFQPTALRSVEIPPGTTVSEDVRRLLRRDAAGWRLTANTRIVASTSSTAGSDLATSGAGPSLEGSTFVPLVQRAKLAARFVGATRRGGMVTVTSYDREGNRLRVTRLAVPGRTARAWTYAPPPKRRSRPPTAYVVINVGAEGDVRGDLTVRSSAGIASTPLSPGVFEQVVPQVVYRPESVLP